MSRVMKILHTPDDRLIESCRHVNVLDISEVIEMFTLMNQQNAYGLAAPQVGINERFFVTHWGGLFVNPTFIPRVADGKTWAPESCLSLPGKTFMVERWNTIQVDGKFYTGLHARIIQHEYDHLDGLLISEVGVLPEKFSTAERPRNSDHILLGGERGQVPNPSNDASS